MVKKCLLSLLVVISITILCRANEHVTSCYVGAYNKYDLENQKGKPVIKIVQCSLSANVGCYRYENESIKGYGCAENEQDYNKMNELEGYYVCKENNCNRLSAIEN